ncbi:hypothetical protein PtB15_18B203 [Puccinia triticina]|nr:hypothetical protein PtB15_18B203 [Puccinia triticina]
MDRQLLLQLIAAPLELPTPIHPHQRTKKIGKLSGIYYRTYGRKMIILNVQVPFMFKHIIDSLSIPFDPNTFQGAWTVVGTMIAGFKLSIRFLGPLGSVYRDLR